MKKKILKFYFNKVSRKFQNRIIRLLYLDNVRDTGKSILVVGSARSGTTWLADFIASQYQSRIMFEPFHPILVPEYRYFNYFQYMRPEDADENLYRYCYKIFSGNIRNPWIDREVQHFLPRMRIIKCIRSSLMLKWLDRNFPEVPKIFILRHPCAVVQSRMSLGWATDDDIKYFLNQPKLISDYLSDKLDIISSVKTEEEKHAIIWSITNLIPIKQFQDCGLNLFRYEALLRNPTEEIARLFNILNIPFSDSVLENLKKPSSTTTHASAILTGGKMTDRWKTELTYKQIEQITRIVELFGLSSLLEVPSF